jgi:integrase
LEWRVWLLEKYAEASVAGFVKNLRAVFNWAVDKQKWLAENPIDGIPRGSFVNQGNVQPISMDDYVKLLEACPNQEWRTIVALARIGGLRCPSELKRLRWSDIDWAKNQFLVRSPKTEHHENHRQRIVPLFAELRKELKQHLDESGDNEFVIQGYQGTSWGLRQVFDTIACNAGLEIIWPFVNMRRSRSNEVLRKFGPVKESLWIGHSMETMKKHYFQLEEGDFTEACAE